MRCRSSARNLFHSWLHFLGVFPYIRNTYFQEHLKVSVIHFFLLQCVNQEFTLFISLFFQKIRRPVAPFAPFSLVTKGAFVTLGKISLCVKSHSFIFSLIPYCTLSFRTDHTIPLIFALIAAICDLG